MYLPGALFSKDCHLALSGPFPGLIVVDKVEIACAANAQIPIGHINQLAGTNQGCLEVAIPIPEGSTVPIRQVFSCIGPRFNRLIMGFAWIDIGICTGMVRHDFFQNMVKIRLQGLIPILCIIMGKFFKKNLRRSYGEKSWPRDRFECHFL